MEKIDVKKLETAIIYVDRIAKGNNPITNMPTNVDELLNDPNITQCLMFVEEVLKKIKLYDGYIGRSSNRASKIEKRKFPIEVLASFTYEEDKSITKLVRQINELIDENLYQKLSYKPIRQWLTQNGFLLNELSQEFNKKTVMPTEKGGQLGIRAERRSSDEGDYMIILYNKQAQEFIVQNMKKILDTVYWDY